MENSTQFTSHMTSEEYDKQGKEYTARALAELNNHLQEKKVNKTNTSRGSNRDAENWSDNSDSDDEINTDINIRSQVLKQEVSHELNKYKIENHPSQSSYTSSNTHTLQSNDDRIIHMFNDLISRNTNLINQNNRLQNSHKKLKKKIHETETREYNKQVYSTSLEVEKNSLLEKNTRLEENAKKHTNELRYSSRLNYATRFIIGLQILLMLYMYIVYNIDNLWELKNNFI